MNYWSRVGIDYSSKTIQTVMEMVCNHFEISQQQLKSKCRLRKFVEARSIISYILHRKYKLTSIEVGHKLNRDHATVLHNCLKIEGFMRFDKDYKELVNSFI
jgi:chromosomal replication initiator protein